MNAMKFLIGEILPFVTLAVLVFGLGYRIRKWHRAAVANLALYPAASNKKELWGKVLQIDPKIPGVRNKLADVLIDAGRFDEAIAVLEKGPDVSPGEKSTACSLLGKAYLQLRSYEKARESYRAALAIQPGNGSAWFGLATAQARLGHREQSRQTMARFRELMQDTGQSRTGRMAGRSTDRSQERAQRELAEVRRLTALAHMSVAAVYRANRRVSNAEPHWRRAAELDPRDVESRLALATLYRRSGNHEKALPLYKELVSIDPTSAVYHANMAILYAEMRQYDAALAAAQRAIDLEPGSPQPRRIYQEILKRKQGGR